MPRAPRRKLGELLPCLHDGCGRSFRNESGRTIHTRAIHSTLEGHRKQVTAQDVPLPPPPGDLPEPERGDDDQFDLNGGGGVLGGHGEDNPGQDGPKSRLKRILHPYLTGDCYTKDGNPVPKGSPPASPRIPRDENDWTPFEGPIEFRTADFLYRREEMSQGNINLLLELWGLSAMKYGATHGPFDSYQHIYDTIDEIEQGDAPWGCMKITPNEDVGPESPSWKRQEYEVWHRDVDTVLSNILDNPDFDGQFDYAPYVELEDVEGTETPNRRWSDFMSANYAWNHSTAIFEDDPSTRGATYVPLILGADKTTVSVATGNVEYHPLYLSIGNVHNTVRRAHRNAVVPIAFLAIPKGERKSDPDPDFRRFKQQLYHSTISAIFNKLKPQMSKPALRRCPDGHYRRIIYDFGPFIADYPEQVLLAGIVQGWCPKCTALPSDIDGVGDPRDLSLIDKLLDELDYDTLRNEYGINSSVVPFTRDFPRANISEMLSSDLLHQVIKGTFKDHLVTWVEEYLEKTKSKADASAIMDQLDLRLSIVPAFSGLRNFKDGRRFKQWTGDDSKALMKVIIPALHGLVPPDIVKCFQAFLDFCYLVRRNDITSETLKEIKSALHRFHHFREIFRTAGVRGDGFSLPRQHSLVHYEWNIMEFGAPNGLCSSITESRHITAVKKPWRRSSRFEALGQMLLINQRLDKLIAARTYFVSRGMLPPDQLKPPDSAIAVTTVKPGGEKDEVDEEEEEGWTDERVLADVKLARTAEEKFTSPEDLATFIKTPSFPDLLHQFLVDQLNLTEEDLEEIFETSESGNILDSITDLKTFRSAVATFFAPSDVCGIRGMRREAIRCHPSWRKGKPRYDCAFIVEDDSKPGFAGMNVVRIRRFFSFDYEGTTYPCAVVEWFKKVGNRPDPVSGMWMVDPDMTGRSRDVTVIHIDTILRAAHLMPVYGAKFIPRGIRGAIALDCFSRFYVNKYIDHHANEIAF